MFSILRFVSSPCTFRLFQTLQQNLAHAEQVKVDAALKNEMEYKQQLEDLRREDAARKVS